MARRREYEFDGKTGRARTSGKDPPKPKDIGGYSYNACKSVQGCMYVPPPIVYRFQTSDTRLKLVPVSTHNMERPLAPSPQHSRRLASLDSFRSTFTNVPAPSAQDLDHFRRDCYCNWYPYENEAFVDRICEGQLRPDAWHLNVSDNDPPSSC